MEEKGGQGGRPGGVIRAGEWKLIELYEESRRELFHLAKDVSESRNLAEQEPDRVRDLAAKLDAWRKDVGALLPEPNPEYVPNPQAANGEITLPAKTADVRGVMLRFEPLPHKNTLGSWVNAKAATIRHRRWGSRWTRTKSSSASSGRST